MHFYYLKLRNNKINHFVLEAFLRDIPESPDYNLTLNNDMIIKTSSQVIDFIMFNFDFINEITLINLNNNTIH